jgi:pimeloyl-ACP methyl ester carboxylesterase
VRRVLRFVVIVIGGLVCLVIIGSVAYNLATSDPNVPVEQLWHGKVLRTDGYVTAYREWGSGSRQVVLVGGFLEPTFVWDKVAPLLAVGYHVYALDLDGFGYTERHGPWTLAHWGDQVQSFMQARHIRRPIVIGHSLGAAIAVETARRGLASGIVLVDGDALRSGGPPRLVRTALVHSPFFTTAYRFALRSPWLIRRILRTAYGPNHPKLDNAEISRWTDQFRAAGARHALQGIVKNGIPGFTHPQLRQMRVRALVIWGATDSVDPVSAGREAALDLNAPFVEVPRAGHLSMLAAANQVVATISKTFAHR